MKHTDRKQYVVDKEIQVGLVWRMGVYWAAMWFAVFAGPSILQGFTDSVSFQQVAKNLLEDHWFPMAISLILFPLLVWDSVRFSNRVAGPVYRINRGLRDLLENKSIARVKLRDNDFCKDLAESVNLVAERLANQERRLAESNTDEPELAGTES